MKRKVEGSVLGHYPRFFGGCFLHRESVYCFFRFFDTLLLTLKTLTTTNSTLNHVRAIFTFREKNLASLITSDAPPGSLISSAPPCEGPEGLEVKEKGGPSTPEGPRGRGAKSRDPLVDRDLFETCGDTFSGGWVL